MTPIRILLADDQAMIRSGLRLILETDDDLRVVGEAADGQEAIDLAARLHPDILLMDIQMPRLDGVEATRRIVAASTPPRVIILTTFDFDEYLFESLQAGASGFLLKNAPADELVRGIRVVAAGGSLLSPEVTGRVIRAFVTRRPARETSRLLERLSDREREVLVLIARGLSNHEIAERLFLGEATVKSHVGSILGKLELRDRVAAVIFGYQAGLVG